MVSVSMSLLKSLTRPTWWTEKDDDPEQLRAIGWCGGRLCSVIFEIRHDSEGEYYHLITAWKATQQEEQIYADNI